jgi:dihydroxy-acid dehydratase
MKPSGKYMMEDLHKVGGVPAVMKYLLKLGWIDGDCLTVTGKTIAENLADVPEIEFENQKIILPRRKPYKSYRPLANIIRKPCRRRQRCQDQR